MSIGIAPLVDSHQSPGLGYGFVEKGYNHRQQPSGALGQLHMNHAREHRKLDIRGADDIAGDASRTTSPARSGEMMEACLSSIAW
jgi:hypothetical protein